MASQTSFTSEELDAAADSFLADTAVDVDGVSTPAANPNTPDAFELQRPEIREKVKKLSEESVALTRKQGAGVTDPGMRSGIALRRGENLKRYLDETVGPGSYRFTDGGDLILRDSSGSEFLADEIGATSEDLIDFVELGGPLLGGVAAVMAAPVSTGVFALAALNAVGAAIGGSVVDVLTTSGIGGATFKRAQEIVQDRGVEAGIDFILGVVGGKVSKLVGREPPTDTVGEVSGSEVSAAATRIEGRTGEELPLTLAQQTDNITAARFESIASKVPRSAELFEKVRAQQDAALNAQQSQLVGDISNASENAVGALQDQSGDLARRRTDAINEADRLLSKELNDIGDSFSPTGKNLTKEESGLIRRQTALRARDRFKTESQVKYEAFEATGAADVEIIDTGPLRRMKKEIEAGLPRTKETTSSVDTVKKLPRGQIRTNKKVTEGGGRLSAVIPPNSRKFLDALGTISDKSSINEIRFLRTMVNDAIETGEAIPGVDQFFLKKIHGTLTGMLDTAGRGLKDPRKIKLLKDANEFYKDNVDQFLEKGIADNFQPTISPGFVENSTLVDRTLSASGTRELNAALKYMTPTEKDAFSRGIYNDLVSQSQSILKPGQVDVNVLSAKLDAMPVSTRKALFGEQLEPIARVLRLMKASGKVGKLDLDAVSDLSGDAVNLLREAARIERKQAVEYGNKIIKPFLRDEIGIAQMNSEDLVPHILHNADLPDIKMIMQKLGNSETGNAVRRKVVQEILNTSQSSLKADTVIKQLVGESQPLVGGKAILETLQSGAGENSTTKIKEIIGEEAFQALKDVAVVRAGQQKVTDVAAAGGLIAGGLFAALLKTPIVAGATITLFRIASAVMTNPALLNVLRTKAVNTRTKNLASQASAQLVADLTAEFKEEPGMVGVVMEALGQTHPAFDAGLSKEDDSARKDQALSDFLDAP